MPIQVGAPVSPVSDREFDRIDYEVMKHAFNIHNRQGRLCDEPIYQKLLASRLRASWLSSVLREVPVSAIHESFRKTYYLDFLVNSGVIFELKSVEALTGEHENQVINYLLLAGLQHGKLINMRPERVDGQLVPTRLTPEKRRQLNFIDTEWQPNGPRSDLFKTTMTALLRDWGGFLSLALYQEAITYFLGGKEAVERRVDFIVDGEVVGGQKVKLLDDLTAFAITGVKGELGLYEEHLRRLLRHTNLQTIQWLNMANHDIVFKTIG